MIPVRQIYLLIILVGSSVFVHAKEGVILLHGLCRTSSSMKQMQMALEEEGYRVRNIEYPSREADIKVLSELAIGRALEDPVFESCAKIHFVTHSLGGILVRSYFARHEHPRLGRVVMLGPPNRGSEVVDAIGSWWLFKKLNGPAGNELGTVSGSTPNQLGPVTFELGIIAGDRSINWINSRMIEGRDDGKVSVENTRIEGMREQVVVHATHPYIMKNKQVIAYCIQFLKSGSFQ